MSIDLSITDAQRDRIFDRLHTIAGPYFFLLMLRLLFSRANTNKYLAIKISGDETDAVITGIRISRAVIRSDSLTPDTDAAAIVWATLVDGGGGTGHGINFYKDQSRSTKVADLDATVDDDETGTIGPESGYQLAGVIDVGTTTGSNVDFAFVVIAPLMDAIADQFDGTETEDPDVRSEFERVVGRISARFAPMLRDLEQLAVFFANGQLDAAGGRRGGTIRRVLGRSSNETILSKGLSQNSNGGIVTQPTGLLEIMRQAFSGNTGGSGAIDVQAATNSGVVAFPGSWTGRDDGLTLDDRAVAGVLLLTCVKALSETPPEFSAVFTPTDPRKLLGEGYDQQDLEFRLTVGQVFRSNLLGIASFTLGYLPAITNETGTTLSTTASSFAVTGLKASNSTSGKVWFYYDGTDLTFYSTEAGRDAQDADKVIATQSSPSTATAYTVEGDTITLTILTGAGLSNGDKGYINFDPPVPTEPADVATLTVGVTVEPGKLFRLIQRGLFGQANGWKIPTDASPQILDKELQASAILYGTRTFGDTP